MAKRLRWFISGTGAGVAISIWVRKRIRQKVEEVTPLALTKATADSVIRLKDRLSAALGDARTEVEETEATLRTQMGLDPRRQSQAK